MLSQFKEVISILNRLQKTEQRDKTENTVILVSPWNRPRQVSVNDHRSSSETCRSDISRGGVLPSAGGPLPSDAPPPLSGRGCRPVFYLASGLHWGMMSCGDNQDCPTLACCGSLSLTGRKRRPDLLGHGAVLADAPEISALSTPNSDAGNLEQQPHLGFWSSR